MHSRAQGRTVAELCSYRWLRRSVLRCAHSGPIREDPDAGKDQRREEKGTTEDEMVACHHRLNGREFEQTPGDTEGWVSLACCSPGGHKELDAI